MEQDRIIAERATGKLKVKNCKLKIKSFIEVKVNSNKINRKKFLFYSGISVAGAVAFIKSPFNFLREKIEAKAVTKADGKIKIEINPLAVKRNNG